jgi:DNA repair protein RadA/Sms
MATKTVYRCHVCNYEMPKWQGKCPNCNNWNTFEKVLEQTGPQAATQPLTNPQTGLQPETLQEVLSNLEHSQEIRIYPFSAPVLNQFWNQGLVAGSLTLLAGEPGLGKSTLALQLLRALFGGGDKIKKTPAPKLLYVTAEESTFELARRSARLNIPKEILVLQSNNYEQIEQVLESTRPSVVIIDSVQTIFSSQIPSSPGSVAQVSTIASQLLALTKSRNISIIIIGHVTKEGQIAGPKTLEHLVDSVLILEPSENSQYRTLSFNKHRFGSTSSLLLLKMETTGLEIVTDPSLALLENLESGVGICYGLALDKDLPLVVEIQALVSKPIMDGASFFGRREALGIKVSKLNTILAISEKYLGLDLKSHDIYIQINGLPKNLQDDSLDLPILLAILSSIKEKTITQMLKLNDKTKPIFAGRLTLSGTLRNSTSLEAREQTAKKLGFKLNPEISSGELKDAVVKFMKVY